MPDSPRKKKGKSPNRKETRRRNKARKMPFVKFFGEDFENSPRYHGLQPLDVCVAQTVLLRSYRTGGRFPADIDELCHYIADAYRCRLQRNSLKAWRPVARRVLERFLPESKGDPKEAFKRQQSAEKNGPEDPRGIYDGSTRDLLEIYDDSTRDLRVVLCGAKYVIFHPRVKQALLEWSQRDASESSEGVDMNRARSESEFRIQNAEEEHIPPTPPEGENAERPKTIPPIGSLPGDVVLDGDEWRSFARGPKDRDGAKRFLAAVVDACRVTNDAVPAEYRFPETEWLSNELAAIERSWTWDRAIEQIAQEGSNVHAGQAYRVHPAKMARKPTWIADFLNGVWRLPDSDARSRMDDYRRSNGEAPETPKIDKRSKPPPGMFWSPYSDKLLELEPGCEPNARGGGQHRIGSPDPSLGDSGE